MERKKERFKNLDLLRFIGAVIIVYFHINICGLYGTISDKLPLIQILQDKCTFGWAWVDFFFVISGFCFFRYTNFSQDFITFFKKKVIRLCPVIFFAVFLYRILSFVTPITYHKYINVFTLLLLNNVGLTANDMGNIHPVWFVSTLFWTLCFYFYLVKIFEKKYINLIMALIPFFAFTFITNSTHFAPATFYNFINIGIINAMGGIALGYWINEIYNRHKETTSENKLQLIIISAVEIYLFIFIIQNTIFHKIKFITGNYMPLMFAFVPLLYLFLIKKGLLSKFFENNISVLLGKYSYSIFVMHIVVLDFLNEVLWKIHPDFITNNLFFNTSLAIILSIFLGIFTNHFVEEPATRYLKKEWLATTVQTSSECPPPEAQSLTQSKF